MNQLLEIRSYTIKSGRSGEFAALMIAQSLPLLNAAGMNVVAFRRSLHEQDSFVLMRVYRDLAHRQESQDRFYSSDAWVQGPRALILDCIACFTSVVIEASPMLLASLTEKE